MGLDLRAVAKSPRFVDVAAVAALVAAGCWISSPLIGVYMLATADLPSHLTQAWFMTTWLLPRSHSLIGWMPYWFLGEPEFQFYPPLGSLLYAVVYYLTLGSLGYLGTYKVVLVLSYIFPAVCTYYYATRFGFGRTAGFVSGFFYLTTMGGFQQGGAWATFIIGAWSFSLGLGFVPLTTALYREALVSSRMVKVLLAGLSLACAFLTHEVTGFLAVAAILIYSLLFLIQNRRRSVSVASKVLGATLLIAFCLSAFWVVPAFCKIDAISKGGRILASGDDYGERAKPDVLTDVLKGYVFGFLSQPVFGKSWKELTLTQVLAYINLAGFAFSVFDAVRRRSVDYVTHILVCVFSIWLVLGKAYYGPLANFPIFALLNLRPTRAMGALRVFSLVSLGTASSRPFDVLRRARRFRKLGGVPAAAFMVFLMAGSALFMHDWVAAQRGVQASSDIWQVYGWVRMNVPEGSRVAYEEYDSSVVHIFASAPVFTGRDAIASVYGFWWPTSSTTNNLAKDLKGSRLDPPGLYRRLVDANAGYVVVASGESKRRLDGSPLFERTTVIGTFSIYRLRGFEPSYVASGDSSVKARVACYEPELIVVRVEDGKPGAPLTLRVSYFSNWRAYASGRQLELRPSPSGLIEFRLPSAGSYDVTFVYEDTIPDLIGNALSMVGMWMFCLFMTLSLSGQTLRNLSFGWIRLPRVRPPRLGWVHTLARRISDAGHGDILAFALVAGLATILRLWNYGALPLFRSDELAEDLRGLSVALALTRGSKQALPLTGHGGSGWGFIGAFFDYALAVAFVVFGFSPLIPRFVCVIAGVVTVMVTMLLGRRMYGSVGGLLSGLMLAASPANILYASHVGWSASLAPLFVILTLYFYYLAFTSVRRWLVAPAGLCLGIAIQAHPTAVVVVPGIVLHAALSFRRVRLSSFRWPILFLAFFCLGYANMILFNIRYPLSSITSAQKASWGGLSEPLTAILYLQRASNLLVEYFRMLSAHITQTSPTILLRDPQFYVFPALLVMGLTSACFRRRSSDFLLAACWLSSLLLVPVLTKRTGVPDAHGPHYIGLLFPLSYLMFSGFFGWLLGKLSPQFPLWHVSDARRLVPVFGVLALVGGSVVMPVLSMSNYYAYCASTGGTNQPAIDAAVYIGQLSKSGKTVVLLDSNTRNLDALLTMGQVSYLPLQKSGRAVSPSEISSLIDGYKSKGFRVIVVFAQPSKEERVFLSVYPAQPMTYTRSKPVYAIYAL